MPYWSKEVEQQVKAVNKKLKLMPIRTSRQCRPSDFSELRALVAPGWVARVTGISLQPISSTA
jgi:hypothetical protein